MFPTISYVYNDVGDRKSFYETDRVFFHSGVCQIGLSTVNFYRLHYNAFERGCEQFQATLQFLPESTSHTRSNTL